MIAEVTPSKPSKRSRKHAAPEKIPAWHPVFLPMLPAIRAQARFAFRDLDPEAREETMQEVAASAAVALKELWDQGKAEVAYPSVLAQYGIRRAKVGRQVGTRRNVRDVSSNFCQARKKMATGRLGHYDGQQNAWLEVLIEDRHAGPAETAASRIDFAAWLKTLSRRDRKVAWKLALGEATWQVARWFRVSDGRISQLRRELERSWQAFHGELAVA